MVEELADSLPDWSSVNRTRCFTHIVNLIAKSLLKQFDVKPKKEDGQKDTNTDKSDNEQSDKEESELQELAAGIEDEEQMMLQEEDLDDNEIKDEDDINGWVDKMEDLSDEEHKELMKSICPIS